MYKTFLRPISDFCSQVWSPTRISEVESLESVIRSWTKRCPAIRHLHHWDRLRHMNLSSTQRRHERYILLYSWQMVEGRVPSNGAVTDRWGNRGRMLVIPRTKGSLAVKTLRDTSFTVRAGRLFNGLPRYLRDYSGEKATLNGFKNKLDSFLQLVPDRPRDTSGGWLPAAIDQTTGLNSNSLVHWMIHLRKTNPEFQWS